MSSNPYEPSAALPLSPELSPERTILPEDSQQQSLEAELGVLLQQGQNGANWFYWIAGLSLVNSAITLVGGNIAFVVGLAVTGIADQIAVIISQQTPDAAMVAKGAAFGWAVIVALIVVGFGKFASKRYLAIYGIGMGLYLLDGLLFILLGGWVSLAFHAYALSADEWGATSRSWVSLAFHAYALYMLWSGFKAYQKLQVIENNLAHNISFSIDAGGVRAP